MAVSSEKIKSILKICFLRSGRNINKKTIKNKKARDEALHIKDANRKRPPKDQVRRTLLLISWTARLIAPNPKAATAMSGIIVWECTIIAGKERNRSDAQKDCCGITKFARR